MQMLSEDDVDLREMSAEELDRAWDLWFDLAQTTNDWDPPYSHGVFVSFVASAMPCCAVSTKAARPGPADARPARATPLDARRRVAR